MTNIYELSYTWYEDYIPYLFTGAHLLQEEWNKLCEETMEKAAQKIIAKEKKLFATDDGSWIGLSEIVLTAAQLLEEQGFIRINPIRRSFFGSCILRANDFKITSGSDADYSFFSKKTQKQIISHNEKFEKRFEKRINEEADGVDAEKT